MYSSPGRRCGLRTATTLKCAYLVRCKVFKGALAPPTLYPLLPSSETQTTHMYKDASTYTFSKTQKKMQAHAHIHPLPCTSPVFARTMTIDHLAVGLRSHAPQVLLILQKSPAAWHPPSQPTTRRKRIRNTSVGPYTDEQSGCFVKLRTKGHRNTA